MMFNEIVIQEDALPVVMELGIRYRSKSQGYYTMDSVEATSSLISLIV